jgi:hypothetical protein
VDVGCVAVELSGVLHLVAIGRKLCYLHGYRHVVQFDELLVAFNFVDRAVVQGAHRDD